MLVFPIALDAAVAAVVKLCAVSVCVRLCAVSVCVKLGTELSLSGV